MSFEYTNPLLDKYREDKDEARREYQVKPPKFQKPRELNLQPLLRDWFAITVDFQLQAPWFSKDDIPFHVFDNPLHRDRVFRAPFMSASSWKGLLRWACRMQMGLLAHLESNSNEKPNKNKPSSWKDPAEILHLFGNEREDLHARCGALAFRPTWFDKIDFEVINPHDRATKAGKHPILYEVVPSGATGMLTLLYAPSPGQAAREGVSALDSALLLLDAVQDLIAKYGFSAKRTSGWGIAAIKKASLCTRDNDSQEGSIENLRAAAKSLLGDRQ
ncbi:MAG: RAMP superfamily CRISPR-associated protein [Polyangiaceae bacterium]|nr:RAMP superfamily CRISPR-associated protein [Polyangiaceae bacterium]